ncbi:unnamed protein product [Nezara viridula]|uniref:Uncharacterized protein n=1 Tax=Nezara viridula TaxID=85310 RepID=A0A9P0HNE4_NEZVI|nr:unnamed protein product [Nezara viridula]
MLMQEMQFLCFCSHAPPVAFFSAAGPQGRQGFSFFLLRFLANGRTKILCRSGIYVLCHLRSASGTSSTRNAPATAMASFRVFVVFAVAAICAVAAAEEKKEGMMMMKYADDDGSYWPGKYERSLVMPAIHGVVPGVVPAMHAVHPAVYPYGYAHLPAATRAYVI